MHDHIIGLLWLRGDGELANVHDLAWHILDDMDYNKCLQKRGDFPLKKIFSTNQYTDFRCSTNLERFKYCPECGEKIDWNQVRVEIEKELDARGYGKETERGNGGFGSTGR